MHEDIPIHNYPGAQGIHARGRQADRHDLREGEGRVRRQGPAQAGAHRRAATCIIDCDDVLVAVGQENAFPWIERDIGIEFDQWGMPRSIQRPCSRPNPKVFFGGDAAFGPKNIIWAVAHGHEAAISIDQLCSGEDVARPAAADGEPDQPEDGHPRMELRQRRRLDLRYKVPHARQGDRAQGHQASEVELGFDAGARASRKRSAA